MEVGSLSAVAGSAGFKESVNGEASDGEVFEKQL
jgi:hypothetical protein